MNVVSGVSAWNKVLENEPEVKQKENADKGSAFNNCFQQRCYVGRLFFLVNSPVVIRICVLQTVNMNMFSFILYNQKKKEKKDYYYFLIIITRFFPLS